MLKKIILWLYKIYVGKEMYNCRMSGKCLCKFCTKENCKVKQLDIPLITENMDQKVDA